MNSSNIFIRKIKFGTSHVPISCFYISRTPLPDMLKHTTYESALRIDVGLLTSHVSLNRWGHGGCALLSCGDSSSSLPFLKPVRGGVLREGPMTR